MKATFQFLHTIEVSDPELGVLWNSVGRFVVPWGRDMGPHVFCRKINLSTRGQKELELSGVILGETRQEVHLRIKSASGSFVCCFWQNQAVLAARQLSGFSGFSMAPGLSSVAKACSR